MTVIVNKVQKKTVVVDKGTPGPQGPAGRAFFGQIFTQTSSTVTINTADVFVPMAVAGTFDEPSNGMVKSTTAVFGIKNDTGEKKVFYVISSVDVAIGNNRTAGFRLAVNGVSIPASTCTATTGVQNFAKLMSTYMVELDDGDEVSCAIANIGAAENIDVLRAKIVAHSLG